MRAVPHSPDRGGIADYLGEVDDVEALARRLSTATGVVEHGLFSPRLVSEILVGRGDRVERISPP